MTAEEAVWRALYGDDESFELYGLTSTGELRSMTDRVDRVVERLRREGLLE